MIGQESPRVAVVTGGTGGIGEAMVEKFWDAGYAVVVVDRHADAVEKARASRPERLSAITVDLTHHDAPRSVVEHTLNAFGRLDVLVNNAGIGAAKSVSDSDDEEFDRFLDTNLRSVLRLTREALKAMEDGARVIHIASTFGFVGFPNSSSYAATKAALIGLTRQMAVDYGPRGIRTNAIAPGLVASPLTRDRIAANQLYRTVLVNGTPFPRIGTPQDIAAAAWFLASDESAFVNGHVLVVDGGWSAGRYSSEL